MSERRRVLSLDEIALSQPGGPSWHVIRRTLCVQAFGIDAWTATEDGQQVIGQHDNLAWALARAGRSEEAPARVRQALTLEDRFSSSRRPTTTSRRSRTAPPSPAPETRGAQPWAKP